MRIQKFREKLIVISGACVIAAISLVITMTVYNVGVNDNNERKIVTENVKKQDEIKLTDSQKLVVENLISKLDEIESNQQTNKTVESSEIEDNVQKVEDDKSYLELSHTTVNDINIGKEEVVETFFDFSNEDQEFICGKPVDGEIMLDFSETQLVYSKTLDEWTTHEAVDFVAPIDSDIYVVADGKISAIYDDYKYGCTICIEHDDGYVSKYCGVQKESSLSAGDKIKTGDIISKVAKNTGFESKEDNHLHFELLKNGENIKPKFK